MCPIHCLLINSWIPIRIVKNNLEWKKSKKLYWHLFQSMTYSRRLFVVVINHDTFITLKVICRYLYISHSSTQQDQQHYFASETWPKKFRVFRHRLGFNQDSRMPSNSYANRYSTGAGLFTVNTFETIRRFNYLPLYFYMTIHHPGMLCYIVYEKSSLNLTLSEFAFYVSED